MSLRMKALRDFRLRGTAIPAGSVFPVKSADVPVLKQWKYAEDVDGEAQAEAPKAAAPSASKPAPKDNAKSEAPAQKPLSSHTVTELKALAAEHGIELPSKAPKADIVKTISRSRKYHRRDMQAE